MKTYTIRLSVLNMTKYAWDIVSQRNIDSTLTISASDFLRDFGLAGALTAKCNEEEREFFDELYELYRGNNHEL
jgi:hypothetical protein